MGGRTGDGRGSGSWGRGGGGGGGGGEGGRGGRGGDGREGEFHRPHWSLVDGGREGGGGWPRDLVDIAAIHVLQVGVVATTRHSYTHTRMCVCVHRNSNE